MPNPTYVPLLGTAGNVSFGGNLAVAGNETVTGTLGVTGASTLGTVSATSVTASGDVTASGFPVTGPTGPSMQNLIAWNMDPEVCGSTSILASGTLYMHKVFIPRATTITNILAVITTPGAVLTAGQSFAGLYSQNGTTATLLSSSAAQDTSWNSAGTKTVALAVPQVVTAGFYYVGMFSTGTTPPTFTASPGFQNAYNAGLTVSAYRHASNVTGQTTALPASVTLASNVSTAVSVWVGLN